MKYIRDHRHVYYIFQVFMLVFTLIHLGACGWMLVLDPCEESAEGYIDADVCTQHNVYNLYAEAVHLSAVMMLGIANGHIIGSHDTLDMIAEKRDADRVRRYIVSTLYIVVGLFLVALLMSEMNVYIMGRMQGSAAFQQRSDRVKHEMEYYAVPDDLQVQVRAFYDYVWIHQKQYDDKIALLSDDQMSTDLQRKLALHLFKDVVSHISFFSEVDDLLLGEICLSLRTRIFLPQDMIIFKGDVGKELFIIAKGVVEVLRDDLPPSKRYREQPILLRNGSFFGEIALVMEVRRTCSVQARTICEVNILQQQAFDAILRENPHFARRMNELVVARQLDSSLARSVQQGVDFKVSQADLDLAVTAVGKNMKEGLERRIEQEINFGTTSMNSRVSTINRGGSLNDPCQALSQSETISQASQQTNAVKDIPDSDHVDEEHVVLQTESGSNGSILRKAKSRKYRQQSTASAATLSSTTSDVSTIFDDIARRSTRFMDEDTPTTQRKTLVEHAQSDRIINDDDGLSHSTTESLEVRSDGEVVDNTTAQSADNAKRRKKWGRRRMKLVPASAEHRVSFERSQNSWREDQTRHVDEEDSETMRIAGNFSPGRSVVDISKVHPSILNTGQMRGPLGRGRQFTAPEQERIIRMDAKLSQQDEMMRQLIAKMFR